MTIAYFKWPQSVRSEMYRNISSERVPQFRCVSKRELACCVVLYEEPHNTDGT